MAWNEYKLAKKMTVGFGTIITMLIIMSIFSIIGLRSILGNNTEINEMNDLKTELLQREVDHLNWAKAISTLLSDETVTKLEIQKDHHKCGFGKWYYGEERTAAEKLFPSLMPLLKKVGAPHAILHASAISIDDILRQPT